MKLISIVLFLVLSISNVSAFFVEAGLGLGIGDAEVEEKGTQNYSHESFNFGYSADLRAGVSLLMLDLGATASYGKNPAKFTRKDTTSSIFNEVRYDVTFSHLLYGGHVGVKILGDTLKIFGEYYPSVTSEVTYSEPKAENIFGKSDKYEGNGFGLGVSYSTVPFIKIHGLYRRLSFDTLEDSSGKIDLPSRSQGELEMNMFYAGITFFL